MCSRSWSCALYTWRGVDAKGVCRTGVRANRWYTQTTSILRKTSGAKSLPLYLLTWVWKDRLLGVDNFLVWTIRVEREWENFTQAGTKTKGKCSWPGRWAAQMTYQASLSEIPGSKIEETEQSDRGNLDTGGQEEDVRSPLRVCRLVASYPHITFCEYTFTDSLIQ